MSDERRLLELDRDGTAFKPDELEGVPITILDTEDVITEDNRQSAYWVVRLLDLRERLYWAAGRGPTIQVRQWFKVNPGIPLYGMLTRHVTNKGYNVWSLHQRLPDEAPANSNGQGTLDAQLDEVGL